MVSPTSRWRPPHWLLSSAAATFVILVLIAPGGLDEVTPWALARVPVEALVLAGLLLVVPARAGRRAAIPLGVLLGLLALLKLLDLGFDTALGRPFDVLLDWSFLRNGWDYLTASFGRLGGTAIALGVVLAVFGMFALAVLCARRLAGDLDRHRSMGRRVWAGAAAVWVALAGLGANVGPQLPVADRNSSTLAYQRISRIPESLHDLDGYRTELATDRWAGVPGGQLLPGLRGKDVLLVFVESYGSTALSDPQISPGVRAVLDRADGRLRASGFQARSGWLESPTAGGGSWLAHSTLLSGTWVSTQQRYRALLRTDRFTLTHAFGRAGWRTVAVLPANVGPWPEGSFYGYDKVYGAAELGYRGPRFGWATTPDQFTMEAAQRLELARRPRPPVLAEFALVSSHAPWAPLPRMVDWSALGDGTVFGPMPEQGLRPGQVWPDARRVQREYGHSIEYSLEAVTSFLGTHGTDDTVMIVLGDHQPTPIVTGSEADRWVPITIVAKDPEVLRQVAGWGWDAGWQPSEGAPRWPMSQLRDRVLTAFGSAG